MTTVLMIIGMVAMIYVVLMNIVVIATMTREAMVDDFITRQRSTTVRIACCILFAPAFIVRAF